MGRPVIHTLWTGGLDSTARIVELSRMDVAVQPYYVIDEHRASTDYEIRAMKRIMSRLQSDSATKAELRPLIIVYTSEIKADSEIRAAWKELNRKYRVGSQYDFLARYAKEHGIILEVGVEKGEGRAQDSIFSESRMESFTDVTGANFHISEPSSSAATWSLYRHFTFPLWERNKHAEVELMKKLGAEDVVDMTWFCHTPLMGGPCGHCNPCKDARHYGFDWRLSPWRTALWYIVRPRQAVHAFVKSIRK